MLCEESIILCMMSGNCSAHLHNVIQHRTWSAPTKDQKTIIHGVLKDNEVYKQNWIYYFITLALTCSLPFLRAVDELITIEFVFQLPVRLSTLPVTSEQPHRVTRKYLDEISRYLWGICNSQFIHLNLSRMFRCLCLFWVLFWFPLQPAEHCKFWD